MTHRNTLLSLALALVLPAMVSAQATTATPTPKPKRETQAQLQKEARVAFADAQATALKAVPGGTIASHELEREKGKLIYSFDIRVAGKTGVDEVNIDAMTGALVGKSHESPEDEKKEAARDKVPTRPPAKKP